MHVQLVNVDAPNVARVDGTLSMLTCQEYTIRSRFVAGGCFCLTGCVSSDKSAMASCMNSSVLSTIPTSWLSSSPSSYPTFMWGRWLYVV